MLAGTPLLIALPDKSNFQQWEAQYKYGAEAEAGANKLREWEEVVQLELNMPCSL